MSAEQNQLSHKLLNATVLVTSLGYLVDMFDFFLYNMNRVKSLTDLGLSGDALTTAGIVISNWQMGGFLVGAILWGILADKFGRKFALFPSILVYSIGSLACSMVHSVDFYGPLRFITAVGLAGELGTGIALIVEKLDARQRGTGTIIFMAAGISGTVLAAVISEFIDWRACYVIGGVGGFVLLFTRMLLSESGLFTLSLNQTAVRGGFAPIIKNPKLLLHYICGIAQILPNVFMPQLIWTLSPEIGKAMHVEGTVKANIALGIGFGLGVFCNLFAAFLSDKFHNRKKIAIWFLLASFVIFLGYLFLPMQNIMVFYLFNALLGLTCATWALGALWAAEHFGTNIRATVATTTPNFARGLTIPMNMAYVALKPIFGILTSIGIIGIVIFGLAILGWFGLRETYGKDLNYVE